MKVLTNALVSRILFHPIASAEPQVLKAKGVEFTTEGNKYVVSVEREVILCAGENLSVIIWCLRMGMLNGSLPGIGAYQSPQILELSGTLRTNLVSLKVGLMHDGTGIGNREILNKFDIETLVDLPAVGENLRE